MVLGNGKRAGALLFPGGCARAPLSIDRNTMYGGDGVGTAGMGCAKGRYMYGPIAIDASTM